MIVQACINGARGAGFHERLPLRRDDVLADIKACLLAGASEFHLHPRGEDLEESLAPHVVDPLMQRLREKFSGTMFGVSTGHWIGGDPGALAGHIAGWQSPPDYASVNLYEPGAFETMDALHKADVGIEVGIYTLQDAERFCSSPYMRKERRILIEIEEQDIPTAVASAGDILAFLRKARVCRPILIHGQDATAWALLRFAKTHRCSARIGLEDTGCMPHGSTARDNAALVAAAVDIYREK